jgi:hypothetical protein
LAGLVEPTRLACLAFEQAGFNSCRAAQAPQKAGQSQYEFPLYGRLGIVVRNNSRFERFVIFSIF